MFWIFNIKIEGDDIIIDYQVYHGTPGLWSLITERFPKKCNSEDVEAYKEL